MVVNSPKRSGLMVILALTGLLAVLLVLNPAVSEPASTSNEDGLVVLESSLELGKVPQKPNLEHLITVSNSNRKQSLDVMLKASCQCTSLNPASFQLLPGESKSIRAVLDLSVTPAQYISDFQWPFMVKLIGRTTDGRGLKRSSQWQMKMEVERLVVPVPPVIRLSGPNEIVEGAGARFRVRLRSKSPLAHVEARVEPDLGRVEIQSDDDGYFLDYILDDAPKLGEFSTNVRLTIRDAASHSVEEFVVPVTGQVVSTIRITPNESAIPPLPVGTMAESVIAISSLDGSPFVFEPGPASADSPMIELLDRDEPTSPQRLRILVQLTSPGNLKWEIPIRVMNLKDGSHKDFIFNMRGFAIDPEHNIGVGTPAGINK